MCEFWDGGWLEMPVRLWDSPAGVKASREGRALQAFSFTGQPERQVALARRAIERDPSLAAGLGLMGEAWLPEKEAIEALERHNELCSDHGFAL